MAGSGEPRFSPPPKQPRNPISRRQVEAVISRSIAGFAIVFGLQTVPELLGQLDNATALWESIVVPALFGSFLLAAVLSAVKRLVRVAHGTVAVVYALALVTWPFAVVEPIAPEDNHWLYLLLTVATATAAIAFGIRGATVYLFVLPIVYGAIRLTAAGGSASPEKSLLDALYAVILGGAVLIIVTMLRQAASAVDSAQATALERYSFAVRQHATEVERVQVDAIVHDSVLTTLLSAARAYTPEAKALAASMAGRAIGHLRDASSPAPDDTSTPVELVFDRLQDAAASVGASFEVRRGDDRGIAVPALVAESMYSAAVQAMVNSVQHAGGADVGRWLVLATTARGGLLVEVGDSGRGFALDAVPRERLGVRVSILERVANVGGVTEIDSQPGEGTVVTLAWPESPAALAAAAPALDESGAS